MAAAVLLAATSAHAERPVLVPQHTGEAPHATYPLAMPGGVVFTAPLGNDRLLLVGAKQSWLWNARARELNPVPALGRWRQEFGLQGVVAGGRLLLAGTPETEGDTAAAMQAGAGPQSLLLYDPVTATTSTARLRVKRNRYRMVALAPNQVLIVGGAQASGDYNDRLWQVERVSWDERGTLKVEMLPGLNDSRRDSEALRLPDGRVMVIGGLRETTEFFDVATRRWRYGPALPEPVVRAQSALFRDGRVLLVSGRVWLWKPGASQWEDLGLNKSLDALRGITPISDDEVIGVHENETRIYDLRDRTLRVGPDLAEPHQDVRFVRVSSGELHVFDAGSGDGPTKPIEVVRIPPKDQQESGELAVPLSTLVPARLADGRVLLAGNWGSRSINPRRSYIVKPAVPGFQLLLESESYDRAPLGVFNLRDGSVLLVGGEAVPKATPQERSPLLVSQRWHPATGRWQRTAGPSVRLPVEYDKPNGQSVIQRASGDIVFLDPSAPTPTTARVMRWNPATGQHDSLGVLQRWRSGASVIELRDGRLVVVGGQAAGDAPAVGKACTDCADDYVPVGRIEESTTSEVYDPAKRSWQAGPRNQYPGGRALPLVDGRVVKISHDTQGAHMEISDAAFTRWQSLPVPKLLNQLSSAHLLMAGPRLVVIGQRFDKDNPALVWSPDTQAWQEWRTGYALAIDRVLALDGQRLFIIGRDTRRNGVVGVYTTLTLPK